MALMMARLILASTLIYFSSASPFSFFAEKRYIRDIDDGNLNEDLQSEIDREDQQLQLQCDAESVIIAVSPNQYNNMYLLIGDERKISIRELLEECSYVEMEYSSLIRIFYKGCSLDTWLGQEMQYTLTLVYFDTKQIQICPSSTTGGTDFPAVKCESVSMTVTLAAKELIEARFVDLDASSLEEIVMTEEDGLTQLGNGEYLVIQVENPMKKDLAMLLLQYIDIMDKLNMVKVFCPQHQTKNEIPINNKYSNKGHHGPKASENYKFPQQPFIQWAMPLFMSEAYRPSSKIITSINTNMPSEGTHTTGPTTTVNAELNPTESSTEGTENTRHVVSFDEAPGSPTKMQDVIRPICAASLVPPTSTSTTSLTAEQTAASANTLAETTTTQNPVSIPSGPASSPVQTPLESSTAKPSRPAADVTIETTAAQKQSVEPTADENQPNRNNGTSSDSGSTPTPETSTTEPSTQSSTKATTFTPKSLPEMITSATPTITTHTNDDAATATPASPAETTSAPFSTQTPDRQEDSPLFSYNPAAATPGSTSDPTTTQTATSASTAVLPATFTSVTPGVNLPSSTTETPPFCNLLKEETATVETPPAHAEITRNGDSNDIFWGFPDPTFT